MDENRSNISPNDSPKSSNGNAGELPMSIDQLRTFKGYENISIEDGIRLIQELGKFCDILYDINSDYNGLS